MAHDKPKRFRLNLVNAAEDVPRLVRAYGRACMGEFALVLRPHERRGVLVLVTKEGAAVWRSGAGTGGAVRATATVVAGDRPRLRIDDGPHAGVSFFTAEPKEVRGREGEQVEVEFEPDDQFARLASGGDAPAIPTAPIAGQEAVALVKAEQRGLPKAAPITLRGQWSGYLHCDGEPKVELTRKLAAYGVLRIVSSPKGGWTWTVERAEKWFSKPGADTGKADTLLGAIEAGLARAMGLLGQACSVRDSRRRAALDTAWAAEHPVKPAKEGKDPTERMKEPPPPKAKKAKAPPPPPMDAPIDLPDAPATDAALRRMADEVAAEADALADLRSRRWVWEETDTATEVQRWFADNGFDHEAGELAAFLGNPWDGAKFLADLRGGLNQEPSDRKALALPQVDRLETWWAEAPQLMARARKLIRRAAVLTESKLCRGKEKKEAAEALRRAVQAYDEARAAIVSGQPVDGTITLRRIGERVALSAAKSARSCALGQQSLTAASKEKPAKAAPPTGKAATPKKPRTAKTAAPPRPTLAPAHSTEPAVDADKDKALLDAFSAAIAQAMAGGVA